MGYPVIHAGIEIADRRPAKSEGRDSAAACLALAGRILVFLLKRHQSSRARLPVARKCVVEPWPPKPGDLVGILLLVH